MANVYAGPQAWASALGTAWANQTGYNPQGTFIDALGNPVDINGNPVEGGTGDGSVVVSYAVPDSLPVNATLANGAVTPITGLVSVEQFNRLAKQVAKLSANQKKLEVAMANGFAYFGEQLGVLPPGAVAQVVADDDDDNMMMMLLFLIILLPSLTGGTSILSGVTITQLLPLFIILMSDGGGFGFGGGDDNNMMMMLLFLIILLPLLTP